MTKEFTKSELVSELLSEVRLLHTRFGLVIERYSADLLARIERVASFLESAQKEILEDVPKVEGKKKLPKKKELAVLLEKCSAVLAETEKARLKDIRKIHGFVDEINGHLPE